MRRLLSFFLGCSGLSLCLSTAVPAQAGEKSRTPASRVLQRFELGLGFPFSYNTANATTTTKEWRTGPAIAAKVDLFLWQQNLSLMASFSKTQVMWSREDGTKNPDICSETFSMALMSFPGYCTQYQARLQPLLWLHSVHQPWLNSFAVGLSFAYNHITDISFKGSRIYNTKWAYGALGAVVGYRIIRGRFSLLAFLHFDYGIFSQTATIMTPTQKIQGVQAGVTVYGMYALF